MFNLDIAQSRFYFYFCLSLSFSSRISFANPSGDRVFSCRDFEVQLHNFKSSSIACTSLDESYYSDQCGCSELAAFIPCSLWAGGEATLLSRRKRFRCDQQHLSRGGRAST